MIGLLAIIAAVAFALLALRALLRLVGDVFLLAWLLLRLAWMILALPFRAIGWLARAGGHRTAPDTDANNAYLAGKLAGLEERGHRETHA